MGKLRKLSVFHPKSRIERDDGCIVVDDFLVEKPHSTPNSIITVNWDHSRQCYSLSTSVVNFLYTVGSEDDTMQLNLPLAFEVVSKAEAYTDPKTGKEKVRSAKTKNALVRLAVISQPYQGGSVTPWVEDWSF